jgi:hypothetical protein
MLWGASTLLVSAVLKLTPAHWMKKMPIVVDENKQVEEDGLMKLYNK